jgi:hypothetical protein
MVDARLLLKTESGKAHLFLVVWLETDVASEAPFFPLTTSSDISLFTHPALRRVLVPDRLFRVYRLFLCLATQPLTLFPIRY